MSDKTQKLVKLVVVTGVGIGTLYLITKYRQNIIETLKRTKQRLVHDIIKLPRRNFTVEVISNSANDDLKTIIAKIIDDCKSFPVIGFDCEWVTVNNDRRKVALVQICSPAGLCGLFRVCKFSKFPQELREILENPDILKVGVTPEADGKYLMQDYAINMNGTFDLRFLALQTGKKAGGLAALSKLILNIELDKNWRLRCSDWEIETLSEPQIDYAAKDAFVAVEIFKKLYDELNLPKKPEDVLRFGDNYSDISFKNKLAQLNLDPANQGKSNGRYGKIKDLSTLKKSYTTRSSPLYDNCKLLAPDGDLLCFCDRSKAEWYVKKGRGVQIESESVYTVQLNFEPSGRAVAEVGEFYRSEKENRCAVCGSEENLVRKNVIPHEYRKFFPSVMKSKTSHDILLLCIECHQKSNISENVLRLKLKAKCNAPLEGDKNEEDIEAAKILKCHQKLARALLKGNNIPDSRIQEMKEILTKAYPGDEINDDFLIDLMSQQPSTTILNSHGNIVVQKFIENEGLVALEKMWREHFLNFMKPKYLPNFWNVNHNEDRLLIRAQEGRVTEDELKMAGIEATIAKNTKATTSQSHDNSETKMNNSSNENSSSSDHGSNNSNNNYIDNSLEEDDVDSSSEWEYQSAYSYRLVEPNKDSTDDERYFSDAASFYTLNSYKSDDTSTIGDFKSFNSSANDLTLYDSGEETEKASDGSETEVEDENNFKMEK